MLILPTFLFLYSGLNHETTICPKLLSKVKNVTFVRELMYKIFKLCLILKVNQLHTKVRKYFGKEKVSKLCKIVKNIEKKRALIMCKMSRCKNVE